MKAIAFVLVFLFIGCTKTTIVCDISKSVSSLVSAQVATQLTCKNLDAVKASVDEQLVKLKICEAPAVTKPGLLETKSAVGDVICGPVIDALSSGFLTQIPPAWECSGGPLTDSLKAQLLAACKKGI